MIENFNVRRTKVSNQSLLKLWKIVEEVRALVSQHFIANQICVKRVNGWPEKMFVVGIYSLLKTMI